MAKTDQNKDQIEGPELFQCRVIAEHQICMKGDV